MDADAKSFIGVLHKNAIRIYISVLCRQPVLYSINLKPQKIQFTLMESKFDVKRPL